MAHIAYFRKEYVDRRGWLTHDLFSELVALAQILPGPSSSQLGMSIGHLRAGFGGAVVAWLGFTLPSAILMVLFAGLWEAWPPGALTQATHGLLLVAAAVVFQAVVQLYRSQCRTGFLGGIAWMGFSVLLCAPGPWSLAVVLTAAGVLGTLRPTPRGPSTAPPSLGRRWGVVALGTFFLLAVGLPLLRTTLPMGPWAWADAFFRTGSWVFGGGHVVLPWLQKEVVGPGWVTTPTFLAGYGAAQALPGPLFSVAAFLGMVVGGVPGAAIALVAIFLPGFLLIEGVLPFWARLRERPRWTGALAGVSAVVVGLLASALVTTIGPTLQRPSDWAVVGGLFLALEVGQWPSWLVVILGALVGFLGTLLG